MPGYNLQDNASREAYAETDDDEDMEFVEVDPAGRYGRYNEILGVGAFKTVYRAFDKFNGIEVAWNQVNVQVAIQSSKDLERLYSEVHLLKTLKHKNIIKFYDSWVNTKTKNVNFITEIFTSGNLRQYRKKHKRVDLKAVKSWARQILRGLLYLHSHDPPIIHRDIKCDNIFINGNNGEVKIGDLGLAVVLQQTHSAHSVIGTPEFMAPELYEEEYTELVDIYSFGMCVLELITLEYPYSECKNAAQIYKKVTSGKKPAALDKVKDSEVRSFVEKCLADASCRLPARELLMDPFLQSPGNLRTIYPLPYHHSQVCTDAMMELGTILAEPTTGVDNQVDKRNKEQFSHSSQIRDFVRSDKVPGSLVCGFQRMDSDMHKHIEEISSSNVREPSLQSTQGIRSGSIKADQIIRLMIRLRDKEGHFRCIHFSFNVEVDTALCVASEMITALGLSEHDVTAIAEKIDSELISLVPHWKPGFAFDESVVNDEENSAGEMSHADGCSTLQKDKFKVEAFLPSEGPILQLLSSSHSSSHSSTVTSSGGPITVDFPMIYGHFEEEYGNFSTSNDSCQSGEFASFSSDDYKAHDVGNIKDIGSELISSGSLNPAIVEEGRAIYCGSSGSDFSISSCAEAAVAFKSGWVDASEQISREMHREENSLFLDIKSSGKAPDKPLEQLSTSEPSEQLRTSKSQHTTAASISRLPVTSLPCSGIRIGMSSRHRILKLSKWKQKTYLFLRVAREELGLYRVISQMSGL